MCQVDGCTGKVIARSMCQFHYDRKRRYGDEYTRPKSLVCPLCLSVFAVRPTGNLPKHCDECQLEVHRTQMRNDRRRKGLWELYKITLAEYQVMHDAQNGLCAICKLPTKGRGQAKNTLAVDHNHTTGKIRGLLCTHCNTGLGLFRDDIQLLKEAINYLQERDN